MSNPSLESFLENLRSLSEERYATIQAVRALARRAIHPLTEELRYGGIVFMSGVPFGGVFPYQAHVSVEFSAGASIEDPHGQLEGKGKLRRHIKLRSLTDVKDRHVAQYMPLALQAALGAR